MGYWKTKEGYRVYCGVDEAGKQIRKRCKTIEDARRILATCRQKKGRYDIDLFALPEKVKSEVYNVLLKCQELGVSLSDLLDFYCDKTGQTAESKSCRECADMYVENMKITNKRAVSIRTMECFFKKFFYSDVSVRSLTFEDVKKNYDTYEHPQTKFNFYRYARAFFNFCIKQGYCDKNLALDLPLPVLDKAHPHIFTISQIKTLLARAEGENLTFTVIGLFCGLRPIEYKRLKKTDIDLEKRIIRIDSDVAKTRTFRNVKIAEAPYLWLKKYGVHLPTKTQRLNVWAKQLLKMKDWPLDIMRHTAASMMLARDQSADAVALQLGNSPAILHKHYKNLVTDAEAAEFWNLTPESVGR